MPKYVAFLRGMNLGRRRIKNPELCAAFEQIGFSNVSAFMASGNVIFGASDGDAKGVAEVIEVGLKDSLGYDVPTFLRTADEVRTVAEHSPFASVGVEGRGKLQVAFLADAVGVDVRESVLELSTDEDLLELVGRELYWSPKGNFLDSGLDLKAVERIVGPHTIRTKATVERIVAKHL